MSKLSRRTTLAMLGFAPPGAAVGAETFKGDEPLDEVVTGHTRNESLAKGLRHMADQVEAGTVMVETIELRSRIAAEETFKHYLAIDFWYAPDKVS